MIESSLINMIINEGELYKFYFRTEKRLNKYKQIKSQSPKIKIIVDMTGYERWCLICYIYLILLCYSWDSNYNLKRRLIFYHKFYTNLNIYFYSLNDLLKIVKEIDSYV